jgi:hypothetical protein
LYVQWKHRFTDQLTLNAGVSVSWFALNGSTVVELRAGLQYQASPSSSLRAAYGPACTAACRRLTYFFQSRQPDGSSALTNQDLGFTRSHHFVLAYDRQFPDNLRRRAEGYYQILFDAPVERTPTNKGNLVNEDTGRNYGVELILERAFADDDYFLLTTSVFDSKYEGSEGVKRNTPFNTKYVANALVGREFKAGRKDNVFTVSLKAATTGGRYVTPINYEASSQAGPTVFEYDRAFSEQQPRYFRADVKLGYKEARLQNQPGAPDARNSRGRAERVQQRKRVSADLITRAPQKSERPTSKAFCRYHFTGSRSRPGLFRAGSSLRGAGSAGPLLLLGIFRLAEPAMTSLAD